MRSRIRERRQHLRSGLLDVGQTLGQGLRISVPQLNVVARCRTGIEPDGIADDEGRSFGFRLTNPARCGRATIATMQKLMRQFVRQRREFFRG